ncbi:MAG: hypothetical protein VB817_05885, partial [Pirellulaceae bacterium]
MPSRSKKLLLVICLLALLVSTPVATIAQDDAPGKSFSVILLPDTQNYAEKYPETYVNQTLWIRKQLKTDNIKFAVHLGDIVQTSTKKNEWENAKDRKSTR